MVQVRVAMMAVDASGTPVLLLKPVDPTDHPGIVLPIWIGPMESTAILIASGHVSVPQRPMTYDLMVRVLEACGTTVERVEVTDLVAGTFHATLTLRTPAGVREVDARPSDSIALAVRVDAPVHVADHVLEEAGVPDMLDEDDEEDPGRTMDEFTDFLEHVDPDDFRN